MQLFLKQNPDIIEELRKDSRDEKWYVYNYIVNRIDQLIDDMQKAYDLSNKVIYSVGWFVFINL